MSKRYRWLCFDWHGTLYRAEADPRASGFDLLYPGVVELLNSCQQSGYHMAVVTNNSHAYLRDLLYRSRIASLLTHTYTADQFQMKPHPAMLQQLMVDFSLVAQDILMIGDSASDMMMAQSVQIDRVGLTQSGTPASELEPYEPIAIFNHIAALQPWLISQENKIDE